MLFLLLYVSLIRRTPIPRPSLLINQLPVTSIFLDDYFPSCHNQVCAWICKFPASCLLYEFVKNFVHATRPSLSWASFAAGNCSQWLLPFARSLSWRPNSWLTPQCMLNGYVTSFVHETISSINFTKVIILFAIACSLYYLMTVSCFACAHQTNPCVYCWNFKLGVLLLALCSLPWNPALILCFIFSFKVIARRCHFLAFPLPCPILDDWLPHVRPSS